MKSSYRKKVPKLKKVVRVRPKVNEVEEVKLIVTEDERELWEKFKERKERKVPNSGIMHVEHEEVIKKVEK